MPLAVSGLCQETLGPYIQDMVLPYVFSTTLCLVKGKAKRKEKGKGEGKETMLC